MSQDQPALFNGYFERSMDAKKRISVPASFLRKEEGEEFYVVPHPSYEFLMIMPPAEFNSWEQKINASSAPAPQKRMAIRKFYSEARTVQTDKQGRVLLPEYHCERTALNGEVVILGSGSRIEVWSKDRFTQAEPAHTDAYQQISEIIGL